MVGHLSNPKDSRSDCDDVCPAVFCNRMATPLNYASVDGRHSMEAALSAEMLVDLVLARLGGAVNNDGKSALVRDFPPQEGSASQAIPVFAG